MLKKSTMGKKKSQNTEGQIKKSKSESYLEKKFKRRMSTLKKSARELAILCNALCVMEGPTGDVEIWLPENQAEAEAIITNYRQSKRKPKLSREVSRSTSNLKQLEGENKGLAMGINDQPLSSLESLEGFDMDQFVNSIMLIGDDNKGFDMGNDIDQIFMSNTVEHVEPNKGGIFEIAEPVEYEGNKDFDQMDSSFGDEGSDNSSGESSKYMSHFSGSTIDTVDQGITSSIEGSDDHDQQKFEYDILDNGSNSLEVDDYNVPRPSYQDFEFLSEYLSGTSDLEVDFSECSWSNAPMPTAPAGYNEHDQIDNACGMWPSDTLWPLPQYSGLEGAYDLTNLLDEFENENSNISHFLSSLDEQPKLMGSNKSTGDIGRN